MLPVRGITYGTIDYATSQTGLINVLDMQFTLSRPDIVALKFEIPMVDSNNQPIFGPTYSTSFFDLSNGDEYPCGNNQPGVSFSKIQKCYLFYGDYDFMGAPTQIVMTDVTLSSSNVVNARILLMNPSIVGMWVSVGVKAYAGTDDQSSLYGDRLVGSWQFDNVFVVTSNYVNTYNYIPYSYIYPDKRQLWRDQTSWTISPTIPHYGTIPVGNYVIMQFPIFVDNAAYSERDNRIC
jgi:hypothetical protein